MAGQTITLKFRDSDVRPQKEWRLQLDQVCRRLVAQGEVTSARPQAVFPGDRDPAMASMFTVDVVPGDGGAMTVALRALRGLPGIQYAQLSAPRRSLGTPIKAATPRAA
jgi:hypothetical protein